MLLLGVGSPVWAQARDPALPLKPLKLAVRPLVPRPRSQSPMVVDLRLSCNVPRLYSGRLIVDWYLNKRLVHEYVSPELTVTEGGYMFRVQVPLVVARAEKTPVNISSRFVMDKEVIELDDETGPPIPPIWKRAFLEVIVLPQDQLVRPPVRDADGLPLPARERNLGESLALEQFNPIGNKLPQTQLDSSLDMLTYPARLPPEDIPTNPEACVSFDLVYLEGPGFRQLKARQLAALAHWVAAGGSVVVWPQGPLQPYHAEFLNRLAGFPVQASEERPEHRPAFTIDDQGQLSVDDRARPSQAKYTRHSTGLGRTLIVHEPLDLDRDCQTEDWKSTVAFLWKVRQEQRQAIATTGLWSIKSAGAGSSFDPRFGNALSNRPYAPTFDDLVPGLRQHLLPVRIEGVPLAVVAVILVAYLLTIAPGDYYLLGRFHCRKYTWWFFVAVSAAFTGCTVFVAQRYMGQADYHTSLLITDLADRHDGTPQVEVVRVNRFDMLFVARQTQLDLAQQNTLYTDLTDRATYSERIDRELDRSQRAFVLADDLETDVIDGPVVDLPVYSGVLPVSYSVHQQMRQWSPRINRQTALHDEGELLARTRIDWSRLRSDEWHTPAGRLALRDQILAVEPEARILLLNRVQQYGLAAEGEFLGVRNAQTFAGWPGEDVEIMELVIAASARVPVGFFDVVSQVAPTGGEMLEDLSLLDSSDAGQWLLVVAMHRDSDWIVYRRLFGTAR